MGDKISLANFDKVIANYAANPHRSGATSSVKRFAHADSMSGALQTLAEKVNAASSADNLSTLESLKKNLDVLSSKEKQALSNRTSILHKTSAIADFFCSVWSSFSGSNYEATKLNEMESARNELKVLSQTLDQKILKMGIERGKDVLTQRFEAADKLLEKVGRGDNDLLMFKEFTRDDLISLHQDRRFNEILNTSQFNEKKSSVEKMQELERLWLEGCRCPKAKELTSDSEQKVLILLILHLDIDSNFLELSKGADFEGSANLRGNLFKAMQKMGTLEPGKENQFSTFLEGKLTQWKDDIEYDNKKAKLTPENLEKAKQLFNNSLESMVSGSSNPWRVTPQLAKFYMSKDVNETLKKETPRYDELETDMERLNFIKSLYSTACVQCCEFLTSEKGRPVMDLDMDEKIEVLMLVLLKTNIHPSLLFLDLSLTALQRIGEEGNLLTNTGLVIRLFTSSFPGSS